MVATDQAPPAAGATRRTALIGGAACVAGVAALALIPRRRDADAIRRPLARLVPTRLGPWDSHPDAAIVLPDTEVADALYDMTLSRTYTAPGEPPLMLVIAHGGAQSTSWSVHRPETCYAAAGFAIADQHDTAWPIGAGRRVPGRLMTATRDDRIEQVGYWRRIADAFPVTMGEERVIALRRRLAGYIPDGVLVRMSAITADAALAQAAIARFARALAQECPADGAALLLGSLSVAPRTGAARGR